MSKVSKKHEHRFTAEALKAIAAGVPFSLECIWCNAEHMGTPNQAAKLGWSKIHLDTDGHSTNFLGDCPDYRGPRAGCIEKQGSLF